MISSAISFIQKYSVNRVSESDVLKEKLFPIKILKKLDFSRGTKKGEIYYVSVHQVLDIVDGLKSPQCLKVNAGTIYSGKVKLQRPTKKHISPGCRFTGRRT